MTRRGITIFAVISIVLASSMAAGAQKKGGGGTTPPRDPAWVYVHGNRTKPYWALMVANADGSNAKVLLASAGSGCKPCFSPDGKTIVFNARLNNTHGLYTIGVDGTGLRELTKLYNRYTGQFDGGGVGGAQASWSPDALPNDKGKIAYVDYDARAALLIDPNRVDPDGTAATSRSLLLESTLDSTVELRPGGVSWSPDGTRLAVVKNTIGASANSDPSYVCIYGPPYDTPLTAPLHEFKLYGSVVDPAWDPTGDRIAFSGFTATYYDVFTLDFTYPAAPVVSRLTATADVADWTPGWMPDGSRIYFYRYESLGQWGSHKIMSVRPDGTGLTTMLSDAVNANRRRF